jgi:hypothetical protein
VRHLTARQRVLLIISPMPASKKMLRLILATTGCVAILAHAEAQLATNSPFLPTKSASRAPTADAPLEFGGWLETGEGRLYRVIDPARKASTWVKLNERDPALDVIATHHDADNGTLTLEHEGRTLTLPERKAKVVSAGNVIQAMPAPAVNVAPAVTQSVVLNPTPQDEQRRLEAVAAEVARRRALREQATQQTAPAAVPPVRTLPAAAPQRSFQQVPQDDPSQPRGMRRGGPQQR